jgi:hypothetical protein
MITGPLPGYTFQQTFSWATPLACGHAFDAGLNAIYFYFGKFY